MLKMKRVRKVDCPNKLLAAYACGDLRERERNEIREHVESCPVCRRRVEGLGSVDGYLATLGQEQAELPETLRASLGWLARHKEAARQAVPLAWRLGVAVACLGALAVGFGLGRWHVGYVRSAVLPPVPPALAERATPPELAPATRPVAQTATQAAGTIPVAVGQAVHPQRVASATGRKARARVRPARQVQQVGVPESGTQPWLWPGQVASLPQPTAAAPAAEGPSQEGEQPQDLEDLMIVKDENEPSVVYAIGTGEPVPPVAASYEF